SNWILNGTNTYSGPTTISGGGLSVNGSLGNTAITGANGTSLNINGFLGSSASINMGTGSTFTISGAAGPIVGGTNISIGSNSAVNLTGGNGAMAVNVTGPLNFDGSS